MIAVPRPRTRVVPNPPQAFAGFEHVNRFFDGVAGIWTAQVLPGEFYVSRGNEIITTVLGSCVSACVRDVELGLGGMNHFMLPADPDPAGQDASARYGEFALERLINQLVKRGGRPDRFEVKIFGGGKVISHMSDIGRKNVAFVREFLQTEGLTVTSEDVEGKFARRLRYHPQTGQAMVKRLPVSEAASVGQMERTLRSAVQSQARAVSSAELF
jgi:chemotaxis protein CheD